MFDQNFPMRDEIVPVVGHGLISKTLILQLKIYVAI